MFQHLDDPVPLPRSTPEQRRATVDRGESLRRRRRAKVFAATAATAAIVGALALSPALWDTTAVQPAGSAGQSASAQSSEALPAETAGQAVLPVYGSCNEVAGDSVGDLDLTNVALDSPDLPLLHFEWDGTLPRSGSVEALLGATSADGTRSRQFVVDIVDRRVVGQFVRDLQTGEVVNVNYLGLSGDVGDNGVPERVVNLTPTQGLSASFPVGSTRPLGARWTWKLSLMVNGVVVDSCKAAQ